MRLIALACAMTLSVATVAASAASPRSTKSDADAAERASDPQDKIICKRFIETGSLVAGYRECKPKRDWERERDALQRSNGLISCGALAEGGRC